MLTHLPVGYGTAVHCSLIIDGSHYHHVVKKADKQSTSMIGWIMHQIK